MARKIQRWTCGVGHFPDPKGKYVLWKDVAPIPADKDRKEKMGTNSWGVDVP